MQIFDKYIKRGAPLELKLDHVVRTEIVRNIDDATVDIFAWAQSTCFEIMLQQVGDHIPPPCPWAAQPCCACLPACLLANWLAASSCCCDGRTSQASVPRSCTWGTAARRSRPRSCR